MSTKKEGRKRRAHHCRLPSSSPLFALPQNRIECVYDDPARPRGRMKLLEEKIGEQVFFFLFP